MSTEYDSKQSALQTACFFAGVKFEDTIIPAPAIKEKYHPLDDEHKYPEEVEVYTIKNKDGKDATFAIGKFRSGFDLWIVGDNGMMVRT
jgi:hypothetical protein